MCTGVVKCIFITRENNLVILAKKNVKGCFPCKQYGVVSHGTIGISRALSFKRKQNIYLKIKGGYSTEITDLKAFVLSY